ncbi:MAG: proline dehydrogenase family protein [Ignavibacteriaceae bacterium]|nr:proline dehydrogenase family protein [Ignavibacteriaceae bacterium]
MSILNKSIVYFVSKLPKGIVYIFASKYIAGVKLEDAIKVVKDLNSKGILATMDVLGEAISSKDEAIEAHRKGKEVLAAIKEHNLQSNLSIKPTQMGLMIDPEFAYGLISGLVEEAAQMNNFVRLDMEDSSTTDSIINLLRRLKEKYTNTGIVIQAYLKRSIDDVLSLTKIGTNFRLCKGIYIEPESIAIKGKQPIRDNFIKILDTMISNGSYVGIATHDEYLIDESLKYIKNNNIDKSKFEFQMLLGVRPDLRDKLNKMGYKVRIYVPFGKDWYLYSIRRLKENPEVARSIVKDVFGLK